MVASKRPPAIRPFHGTAPGPSAALLSLQDRGFELPGRRGTPFSISPQSTPGIDDKQRLSPLSIVSTPSNYRRSPAFPTNTQDSQITWRKRSGSTGSAETTITNILNLYTNLSKQSLRSEYEEIPPESDSDGSDADNPSLPKVHQPKAQAYRDTIAPLLEHQFSSSNLLVPELPSLNPSPMSLASMPTLMHPDASLSVPSLRLTPDSTLKNTGLNVSSTSIQLTPIMSPSLHANGALIGIFKPVENLRHEKEVNIEVPDVREADSWYDQPLSPVSPEDLEYRNALRESQQSAVSPQTPNTQKTHFRALAFESLSPPLVSVKTSPDLRSVRIVDVEDHMVPPPLDLSRSQSALSRAHTPAPRIESSSGHENGEGVARSQQPSMTITFNDVNYARADDEQVQTSFLHDSSPPLIHQGQTSQERLEIIGEIDRRGSAFSSSSDSFIIYDTFSGQLKALLRDKLRKRKEKKASVRKSKSKEKEERMSGPTMTKNVTTAFDSNDDLESYKYPYGVPGKTVSLEASKDQIQPAYRIGSPDAIVNPQGLQGFLGHADKRTEQISRSSIVDDRRPSTVKCEPLRAQKDDRFDLRDQNERPSTSASTKTTGPLSTPAIPLTKYQKYGIEAWYESNKKKRKKERERLRKEAGEAAKAAEREAQAQNQYNLATLPQRTQVSPLVLPFRHSEFINSTLRLSGPGLDKSQPGFYHQSHTRDHSDDLKDVSRASTDTSTDIEDNTSAKRDSRQRKSDGSVAAVNYNNDLFEVSGGRKMSGLANRLFVSSEEKRKKKVKESITIIGGKKMADGKSLVRI